MKKDKKKNKRKKKSGLKLSKILLIILLVISFIVGLYFFLVTEDEESNLSLLDKQWIENYKGTLGNIPLWQRDISLYFEKCKRGICTVVKCGCRSSICGCTG